MGLRVALESERGECIAEVLDPQNLLHRLLPSFDDLSFQWIRYIDWYENTVFNHLQIAPFLDEWRRLYQSASSDDDHELLRRVEDLAVEVQRSNHRYLKFYGD